MAYATLGHLLAGSLADEAATASLGLPGGTRGVALKTTDGKHAYVVWAESASDEKGSGVVELPAAGDAQVYAWDYSKTQMADKVSTFLLIVGAGPLSLDAWSATSRCGRSALMMPIERPPEPDRALPERTLGS